MSKSYDLSTSSKWSALSDGEHTVQIVAKGTGYRDSAKSTSVTVTKGGATLISFTIAGTSYQAEEGMTWAQWVESSYNTGGYMDVGTLIGDQFGNSVAIRSGKFVTDVSPSDTIQASTVYVLKASTGGGGK